MELILFIYKDCPAAINMKYVSSIVNLEKNPPSPGQLLPVSPKATAGVLLKNQMILAVDKVLQMLSYPKRMIPPSPFLSGCMISKTIEGFAIVEEKIYALLSRNFLKLNTLKSHNKEKEHGNI